MKKFVSLSTLGFFLALLFSVVALNVGVADTALAQGRGDPGYIFTADADVTATTQGTLRENILNIINYVTWFLGLVAVGFIIYAGITLVTSAGNEDKKKTATKIITYAIIGLIIIFLSYAIVSWVVGAVVMQER